MAMEQDDVILIFPFYSMLARVTVTVTHHPPPPMHTEGNRIQKAVPSHINIIECKKRFPIPGPLPAQPQPLSLLCHVK